MTTTFQVPDPGDYGPADFEVSTEQVRRTRQRLLQDPRATEAHRKLGEKLSAQIGEKQATLAQVRRAVGLTQEQVAQMLSLGQGDVSRIEQRSNLHLTTLARFIEATGGHLRITAVYGSSEVALKIGDVTGIEQQNA